MDGKTNCAKDKQRLISEPYSGRRCRQKKKKKTAKGVQHSQARTFLKISLADLGLLLSLQQDFQTIKLKCIFDYATHADCIKSTLEFNQKTVILHGIAL